MRVASLLYILIRRSWLQTRGRRTVPRSPGSSPTSSLIMPRKWRLGSSPGDFVIIFLLPSIYDYISRNIEKVYLN